MEKENLDKQEANGVKPDVTKSLFLAGCLEDESPMEKYFKQEMQTKFGIDKLDIMIRLMPVLEAKGKNTLQGSLDRFKSFVVEKIKRGIEQQENLNLLHGITDYVMTDGGTNERLKAMDYLFELKWLKD